MSHRASRFAGYPKLSPDVRLARGRGCVGSAMARPAGLGPWRHNCRPAWRPQRGLMPRAAEIERLQDGVDRELDVDLDHVQLAGCAGFSDTHCCQQRLMAKTACRVSSTDR